eukprot:1116290-Rhodomonas_salina.1
MQARQVRTRNGHVELRSLVNRSVESAALFSQLLVPGGGCSLSSTARSRRPAGSTPPCSGLGREGGREEGRKRERGRGREGERERDRRERGREGER